MGLQVVNIREHLRERKLFMYKYNNIVCDPVNLVVTFPLYNLSGQYIGYQQYRPYEDKELRNNPKEGRYYTYATKTPCGRSSIAVWGLDRLDNRQTNLYITEGVFKACRLHNFGLNCIAVLGSDPKNIYNWLYSLPYKLIPVCDGDKAGKLLGNISKHSIYLKDGQYLDEMLDSEIVEVIYE